MTLKTRSHHQVQILELAGRFDAFLAPDVITWFKEQTTNTEPQILVNLNQVSFVDSSALAALVQGLKRCRQQGGDLLLYGMQSSVKIIFELTRMDKAFAIYPTETAAIAALSPQPKAVAHHG